MKINPREFADCWNEFLTKKNMTGGISEHIKDTYLDNKKWTSKIIGTAARSSSGSPIGDYIRKKATNLEYRTEENKLDLVFSEKNSNIVVQDIECEGKNVNLDKQYYPKVYEIILEHENKSTSCWEEMVKLTRLRAKLKVLITYLDYKVVGDSQRNILIQNFSMIIESCNEKILINDESYLLIVCQRIPKDDNDYLDWGYTSFDEKGNKIFF